jgi:hypothetical protein
VETIAPVVKAEPGRVTVAKAVSSFLAKKDPEGGSMDPIVKDTYAHYEMLLNDRLIPFCIPHVLGKSDTCDSFRLKTSCFELKPADRIQ